MNDKRVVVIGAGLAGCECSYFLAQSGIEVILYEAKDQKPTEAQTLSGFAELVCTNSLKSMDPNSGHGLLKSEMEKLNSIIVKLAKIHAVPAGDALAVNRADFSNGITKLIEDHPRIKTIKELASNPLELKEKWNANYVVVATGPLNHEGFTNWLKENLTADDFYFYDAIAPVVDADSLDYTKLYFKDRHKDENERADYLNAPMDKEQYEHFIKELIGSKKVPPKKFEKYCFFESCLPVDTMAERGVDTPRFSCMKPIGLEKNGEMPYAVVQLRKENLLGDAYNLVGFQNKLTHGEQKRVFRMIPGLEEADFLHLGSVHRNNFINTKKLLNRDLSSKKYPDLYFSGQITGVEGYTESAASGLYVGWQILRRFQEKEFVSWPIETAIGALVNYIHTWVKPRPSNINFGIMPPVSLNKEQRKDRKNKKRIKKSIASDRARDSLNAFLEKYSC